MDFIRIHPTVSYFECGRDHAPARHWIDFFYVSFPFAGFGYDHTIDLKSMFEIQQYGFIQGNFNEQLMLNETDTFLNDLKDFIKKMKSIENLNGWICGLGHGINKNTPEKNVHLFIENIRKEFS